MAEEEQQWDEAIANYRQAQQQPLDAPSSAQANFGLARALGGKGDWNAARTAYMSFADRYPRDASAGLALAQAAACTARNRGIAAQGQAVCRSGPGLRRRTRSERIARGVGCLVSGGRES